jgi:hypothetical protein
LGDNTRNTFRLTILLTLIAIASAFIYWLAFYIPCHFIFVVARSKVYQDYLYEAQPSLRWIIFFSFIMLGILYGLGWYIARRLRGTLPWLIVITGTLVFGSLLSYIYPIDASDLFNYIIYGRIQHIYGENPFVQVADQFKQDEFFPLISWSDTPSVYGPLQEMATRIASNIAGEDRLINVLVFKWLSGLFMLGCIPVISMILKGQGRHQILANVMILAWNPVVLYEVFGNGHNDIVMVFFILLATWAILQKKYTWTILALTAGGLIKYIPLLLIPVAGLIALRDLPNLRSRLGFIFRTLLSVIVLVILAYVPYWEGFKVITVFSHSYLFTTSIPAILYRVIKTWLGSNLTASIVSKTAILLTFTFVFWQSWRAYRNKSIFSFPQASFNILAFYLLVTCAWFQQWYTVWLIGLAPVLVSAPAQIFSILFGFLALSKQFIMYPLVIYADPRPKQPWYEIELTFGVLGIPWLLAILLLFRNKILDHVNNLKQKIIAH